MMCFFNVSDRLIQKQIIDKISTSQSFFLYLIDKISTNQSFFLYLGEMKKICYLHLYQSFHFESVIFLV